MKLARKAIDGAKRFLRSINDAFPKPVKVASVAVGTVAVTTLAKADGPLFDVSTLYTGVVAAFTAAATIAGGFLAIKFGAKMVKKAWAWLSS